MAPTLLCPYMEAPAYLIFKDTVPPLMYYTNIPAFLGALFLGFFVFFSSGRSLQGKVFLALNLFFAGWIGANIISWTTISVFLMSFVWTQFLAFEILFFVASLYFLYVFIDKKDISFGLKLVFALLTVPVILISPTRYNVTDFDLTDCSAMDNMFSLYYSLAIDVLVIFWVIGLGIKRYIAAHDKKQKQQIAFLSGGTALFLLTFCIASSLNAFLVNFGVIRAMYDIELYGIFGVFIFLGFVTYLIVRYEAFNVKLIGTQALVWALWILVFGLSLLNDLTTIRVVSALTLLLLIGFGLALVRSVKAEVERRQKLQTLSAELKDFNDHLEEKIKEQTEDIHRAYETEKRSREELESLAETKNRFIVETEKHLREPLTTIQHGFTSLGERLENTTLSETTHATLASMADGVSRLQKLVNEFLDISQLAVGKGILTIKPLEVPPLLSEITRKLAPQTVKKDLTLRMSVDPSAIGVEALADKTKFTQALAEITENAMKHSREKGTVTITASAHPHPIEKTLIYRVEITNETDRDIADIRPLLEGSGSQGVGLALVREVVRAHDGRLGIEEREPRHLTIFLEVRGTKNSG